jgi:hypothetical protein
MGYQMKGHSIKGQETFISIPGVVLHLDSRYGIQASDYLGDTIVSRWLDLSASANDVFQNNKNRTPYYTNNLIDSDGISDVDPKLFIRQPDSKFNFLHNGSPFGVYGIFGFNDTDDTGNFQIFDSGAAPSRNGFLVRVNTTASPTLTIRITQNNSNLLSHTTSAIGAENTIQTFGILRNSLNQSNNFKVYVNNSQISNISTTAAATGNCKSFNVVSVSDTIRCVIGILVIYDWTGKSVAEVTDYDIKVRAFLESSKPNFINPL